jgi:hypothetical protein
MLQSYDKIIDPEVQKALHRLQACFGLFKEFNEAAMEEGPDLPEFSEHDTNDTNKRLLDSCLKQLAGLVDCLFDVLPSIDRLRQIWILDLERRSRELATRMALIATAPLPEVARPINLQQACSTEYEPHTQSLGVDPAQHSRVDIKTNEDYPVASRYVPTIADELDHPTEFNFPSKGKGLAGSYWSPPERRPAVRRARPHIPQDDRQKSLQDIVTMDLELATALRLSLVELQMRESQEQQEDQEIMAQLQEWDYEIQRLKSWSDAFYRNVESETSEIETKRLYSIFEQLAKIGGSFGRLIYFKMSRLCNDS